MFPIVGKMAENFKFLNEISRKDRLRPCLLSSVPAARVSKQYWVDGLPRLIVVVVFFAEWFIIFGVDLA